jgi:hypothetical protein
MIRCVSNWLWKSQIKFIILKSNQSLCKISIYYYNWFINKIIFYVSKLVIFADRVRLSR